MHVAAFFHRGFRRHGRFAGRCDCSIALFHGVTSVVGRAVTLAAFAEVGVPRTGFRASGITLVDDIGQPDVVEAQTFPIADLHLVAGVLGFDGVHPICAEGLPTVVHNTAVVIGDFYVDLRLRVFLEVVKQAAGDVLFVDGDESVSVGAVMLVPKADGVTDFMDDDSLVTTSFW